MKAADRYGCELRVFDYGEKVMDRYTMVPPRYMLDHMTLSWRGRLWDALSSGVDPRGCSGHTEVVVGPHLGKRISWNKLPPAVQQLARSEFPFFTPKVFKYETNCVCSTYELITKMNDSCREISWENFLACVGEKEVEDISRQLGYVAGEKLQLNTDWGVSFYSGKYGKKKCVFFRHSAIEHIFCEVK